MGSNLAEKQQYFLVSTRKFSYYYDEGHVIADTQEKPHATANWKKSSLEGIHQPTFMGLLRVIVYWATMEYRFQHIGILKHFYEMTKVES